MARSVLLVSTFFLMVACASEKVVETKETPALKVYNYKNRILISGFPSKSKLEGVLKHQNISAIVDIRSPKELQNSSYNPKTVSDQKELHFYHIPYIRKNQISQKAVQQIAGVLKSHPEGQVLVYCASGARASSWLAVYVNQYQKASSEEAIQLAKDAGLKNQKLLKMTKIHFTTRGKYQ